MNINAAWTEYTQTQREAVKALRDQYYGTVSGWELTNIYPTEKTDSAA